MKRKIVKIDSIGFINHDVLQVTTEKPKDYSFEPGQATDVSIQKEGWKEEKRPFTFTSLPSDDKLQFTIKVYPSNEGVTNELAKLKKGDELTVGDVYGAIAYQGEGTFLGGGAGITPFISILKSLNKENKLNGNSLIFGNKTKKDIFLKDLLDSFLGRDYLNILSKEEARQYANGHIDKDFLKDTVTDFSKYFYVCGPPKMTENIIESLQELGVDKQQLVFENFKD